MSKPKSKQFREFQERCRLREAAQAERNAWKTAMSAENPAPAQTLRPLQPRHYAEGERQ